MRFVDEDEVLVELEVATGLRGADGATPYIGENGDWWVGDNDTGVKARGPAGANGMGSGTVTGVKVGDATYEPDDTGTVDLSGVRADDSSKLGGKAPEYYIAPHNLLDNSDFTNPVKQAGPLGKHGNTVYAFDRWKASSGGEITHSKTDGLVLRSTSEENAYVTQDIILDDGIYTLATYDKDGNADATSIYQIENGTVARLKLDYGHNGHYIIAYINEEVISIQIASGTNSTVNVYAAAVYKGIYTAETLPPYVPKGYAAELTECRMHYKTINALLGGELPNRVFLDIAPMRITPTYTTTISDGSNDGSVNVNSCTDKNIDIQYSGTWCNVKIELNAEL